PPASPPHLHSFPTRRSSDLNHLDLPDRKRMLKQARVASRSTRRLSSTFDPEEAARERLRAWRRHVTEPEEDAAFRILDRFGVGLDRKSTRLNSSHVKISYAV